MIPDEFRLGEDVDEDFLLSMVRLSVAARDGTEEDVALAEAFARVSRVIPGRLRVSPNCRYIVTWRQGIRRSEGEHPPGIVVVADMVEEAAFYDLTVTRPMTAAVSDAGRLVIAVYVWENCRSAAVCRDVSGNMLWQHDFNANLDAVGISASGELAYAATLINPKAKRDSALLQLLDGQTGAVIRAREWLPGAHRELEFRGPELYVVYPPTGESGPVLWTE